MRLQHRVRDYDSRDLDLPYAERIDGPDSGVINSWRVGVSKRLALQQMFVGVERKDAAAVERMERALGVAALHWKAEDGELPVLPTRGGVERPLKVKFKIGALHYLAMWHGLRGEDLDLDTDDEPALVCSRHGVRVVFTLDYRKLSGAAAQD